MEKMAQGSIEYLLIIGAAILVAVVVLVIVSGVGNAVGEQTALNAASGLCRQQNCVGTVTLNNQTYDCEPPNNAPAIAVACQNP